jgi:hypothetical protein
MRTVIIDSKALQNNIVRESILLDSLPDDVMNVILKKKTSLGNNPALPDIFEDGFLERVAKRRFIEVKDELKKIGEINDFSDKSIETMLAKLILKCQKEERPYRQALEKLCLNYVVDLFGVPDDMIQISIELKDEIDFQDSSIQLDPIEGDDDIEYENLSDITTIRDEVYKRRLLNVLSMGAGIQMSSNIKSYLSDLYDINPKLPDLYRKIIALNNYLLFTKEDLHLSDENKMQLGTVVVKLQNNDDKVQIKSQGKIFPVLLSETIRGFMDLFGSHGLPSEREKVEEIIGKADYLKAEPWDMRLGPSLWTILSDSFGDADADLIPYVYRLISKLQPKTFNHLFSEVFAKTRSGKRMMAKIIEKAKEQKDYSGFEDKMSKMKVDKSLLSDEINPDEL